MFKNRKRVASAWAKGLMFGKAVGAKDERERILKLLEEQTCGADCGADSCNYAKDIIELIEGETNA